MLEGDLPLGQVDLLGELLDFFGFLVLNDLPVKGLNVADLVDLAAELDVLLYMIDSKVDHFFLRLGLCFGWLLRITLL